MNTDIKYSIGEILNQINNLSSEDDVRLYLRDNDSNQLRQFFKYAYDPSIEFYIDKFPDQYYNPVDPIDIDGNSSHTIKNCLAKCYLFRKGIPESDRMTQDQREKILATSILNYMNKTEAKYFVQMLSKSLKVNNISYSLIKNLYPGLV